jgi:FkbM family methyltransferase
MEQDINKNFFKENIKKENPTIFDVGTFDGNDCLDFLELFANPTIYAFEADKRSADIFKTHVGDKPINLVETALSNVDGEIEFYQSESDTRRHTRYDYEKTWTASSSVKKPKNHLSVFPDVQFKLNKVKSTRLDTWMLDKDIDLIDIMWVDVNGGEEEFLNGGLDTISEKVNYLYIEFNGTGSKKLYENCFTVEDIKNKLVGFEELGIYNFMGNFGNILLRNRKL